MLFHSFILTIFLSDFLAGLASFEAELLLLGISFAFTNFAYRIDRQISRSVRAPESRRAALFISLSPQFIAGSILQSGPYSRWPIASAAGLAADRS